MAIEAKLLDTGTLYQGQKIRIQVVNPSPDGAKHDLAVSCPLFEKAIADKMKSDLVVTAVLAKTGHDAVTVRYKSTETVEFSIDVVGAITAEIKTQGPFVTGQTVEISVINHAPDGNKYPLEASCPLFKQTASGSMKSDLVLKAVIARAGSGKVTVKYRGAAAAELDVEAKELTVSIVKVEEKEDTGILKPRTNTFGAGKAVVHLKLSESKHELDVEATLKGSALGKKTHTLKFGKDVSEATQEVTLSDTGGKEGDITVEGSKNCSAAAGDAERTFVLFVDVMPKLGFAKDWRSPQKDICSGDKMSLNFVLDRPASSDAEFAVLDISGKASLPVKFASGAKDAVVEYTFGDDFEYPLNAKFKLDKFKYCKAGDTTSQSLKIHQENKVSVFAPKEKGPFFPGEKLNVRVKLKYKHNFEDKSSVTAGKLKCPGLFADFPLDFSKTDPQEKTFAVEIKKDIERHPETKIEFEPADFFRKDDSNFEFTVAVEKALSINFAEGDAWISPSHPEYCAGDKVTLKAVLSIKNPATEDKKYGEITIGGKKTADVTIPKGQDEGTVEVELKEANAKTEIKLDGFGCKAGNNASKQVKVLAANKASLLGPEKKGPFFKGDEVEFKIQLEHQPDFKDDAEEKTAGNIKAQDALFEGERAVKFKKADAKEKKVVLKLKDNPAKDGEFEVEFEAAAPFRTDSSKKKVKVKCKKGLTVSFSGKPDPSGPFFRDDEAEVKLSFSDPVPGDSQGPEVEAGKIVSTALDVELYDEVNTIIKVKPGEKSVTAKIKFKKISVTEKKKVKLAFQKTDKPAGAFFSPKDGDFLEIEALPPRAVSFVAPKAWDKNKNKDKAGGYIFHVDDKPTVTVKLDRKIGKTGAGGKIMLKPKSGSEVEAGAFELADADKVDVKLGFACSCDEGELRFAKLSDDLTDTPKGGKAASLPIKILDRCIISFPKEHTLTPAGPYREGQKVKLKLELVGSRPAVFTGEKVEARVKCPAFKLDDPKKDTLEFEVKAEDWPETPDKPAGVVEKEVVLKKAGQKKIKLSLVPLDSDLWKNRNDKSFFEAEIEVLETNTAGFAEFLFSGGKKLKPHQDDYMHGETFSVKIDLKEKSTDGDAELVKIVTKPAGRLEPEEAKIKIAKGVIGMEQAFKIKYENDEAGEKKPEDVEISLEAIDGSGVTLGKEKTLKAKIFPAPVISFASPAIKAAKKKGASSSSGTEESLDLLGKGTVVLKLSKANRQRDVIAGLVSGLFANVKGTDGKAKRKIYVARFKKDKADVSIKVLVDDCPAKVDDRFLEILPPREKIACAKTKDDKHKLKVKVKGTALVLDDAWIEPKAAVYGWKDKVIVKVKRIGENAEAGEFGKITCPAFGKTGTPAREREFKVEFEKDAEYSKPLVPLDNDPDYDKPPSAEGVKDTKPGILLNWFDGKPVKATVKSTSSEYKAKGKTSFREITVKKRLIYISPNKVAERNEVLINETYELLLKLTVPLPKPESDGKGLALRIRSAALKPKSKRILEIGPEKDSMFIPVTFDRGVFDADLNLEIERLPRNPYCCVALPASGDKGLSSTMRINVRKPLVGFRERPVKGKPDYRFDPDASVQVLAKNMPVFARGDKAVFLLEMNEAPHEEVEVELASPMFGIIKKDDKSTEERKFKAKFAKKSKTAEAEVTFHELVDASFLMTIRNGDDCETNPASDWQWVNVLDVPFLSFPDGGDEGSFVEPDMKEFAAGDEAVITVQISKPAKKGVEYGTLKSDAFDEQKIAFENDGDESVEFKVKFKAAPKKSPVISIVGKDDTVCMAGSRSKQSLTIHEKRVVSLPAEALSKTCSYVKGDAESLKIQVAPPAVKADACTVEVSGPVKKVEVKFPPGAETVDVPIEFTTESDSEQKIEIKSPKNCELDSKASSRAVMVYTPKVGFDKKPVKDTDKVLPGEFVTFELVLDKPAPWKGSAAVLKCPDAFRKHLKKVKDEQGVEKTEEGDDHPVFFAQGETKSAAGVRLLYKNELENKTKTVEIKPVRNCAAGSPASCDLKINKVPKIGFADPWISPAESTEFSVDDKTKNSALISVKTDQPPAKDIRVRILSPAFGGSAYTLEIPAGTRKPVSRKVFFVKGKADDAKKAIEQRVILVGMDGWHSDPENREKKVKVKPAEEPKTTEQCPLKDKDGDEDEKEPEPDWDSLLESPCNLHRMFITVKHGDKARERGPGGKGTFEVVTDKSLAKVPEQALVNPPGGYIPVLQVIAGRETPDPHVPKPAESPHSTEIEITLDKDDHWCRQIYQDGSGAFLRHPIVKVYDKIKGKAGWVDRFSQFAEKVQEYVIKPAVALSELRLPPQLEKKIKELQDNVTDKIKNLYETNIGFNPKKIHEAMLKAVGDRLGLEPDVEEEEKEEPKTPERPYRNWKQRHEWTPILPSPGNLGGKAAELSKKSKPLFSFKAYQASQSWHETLFRGASNPISLPLDFGKFGMHGKEEEDDFDMEKALFQVDYDLVKDRGVIYKPKTEAKKEDGEEGEEDEGEEKEEKKTGFGFVSDIMSMLAFPFMKPKQYLVSVESCGVPSPGGVPDPESPAETSGPCDRLQAIVEVYPSDEFCLHYDFKLPDNSFKVGAKGSTFDPNGNKVIDQFSNKDDRGEDSKSLKEYDDYEDDLDQKLEAPDSSYDEPEEEKKEDESGPEFLSNSTYFEIVAPTRKKKEQGSPRDPSLVFHKFGEEDEDEEEKSGVLASVFKYFQDHTKIENKGDEIGGVLDLDKLSGGKISEFQDFLDKEVFDLNFLSDYNISLTRNGKTGSFYYKITQAIGATLKTWKLITAVFNGFGENCNSGMGYGIEFGLKFLEGGATVYWGWKEYEDHRAFKWYSVQANLTLIEVYFTAYAGYIASAVLVKFKAIVYAKASISAGIEGGFEHVEPGLKLPSFLDLWSTVDAKVEVGVNIVLVHEDVFQINAAIKTGYRVKFRVSPPIPKGFCVEYEMYWMGITAEASFKIIGFKEKKKEIVIIEGTPADLPFARGVWPKSARESWWNIRKIVERGLRAVSYQKGRFGERFKKFQELQFYMSTHPRADKTKPITAHEVPGYSYEGESEDWISEAKWKEYVKNWDALWEKCKHDFILEDRKVPSRFSGYLNMGNLYHRLKDRTQSLEDNCAKILGRLKRLDENKEKMKAFQKEVYELEDKAGDKGKPPKELPKRANDLLKDNVLHYKEDLRFGHWILKTFDSMLQDVRYYADKRREWKAAAEDPYDIGTGKKKKKGD